MCGKITTSCLSRQGCPPRHAVLCIRKWKRTEEEDIFISARGIREKRFVECIEREDCIDCRGDFLIYLVGQILANDKMIFARAVKKKKKRNIV